VLQNKPEPLNFVTLAYISSNSKKIIDIYFYFQEYDSSKGSAIIQYFTAQWVIWNKQMANIWFRIIIIKVIIKDVLIWFGHWIKSGNLGSNLQENNINPFLYLIIWKLSMVGYYQGFYSSLNDRK
jgi:hypothetical protein